MIARIRGAHDRDEFVALHLDERTGDAWVPVRGDRGRSGEPSAMAALALCTRGLHQQVQPLVDMANTLHNLCDRRGRQPSEQEQRRMRSLSGELARIITLAEMNLARLVDSPASDDTIDMDADYELVEQ